jgi:hypothetical protein
MTTHELPTPTPLPVITPTPTPVLPGQTIGVYNIQITTQNFGNHESGWVEVYVLEPGQERREVLSAFLRRNDLPYNFDAECTSQAFIHIYLNGERRSSPPVTTFQRR